MEDDCTGSSISEPSNVDESTLADSNCNNKRSEYLEWPEYFMAISFLSAMRSKDPVTQVGACIVSPDRKIVGIGYNGMPSGCSDDLLPWRKHSQDPLENKYMYVCHAEMNAIMNKNSADVKGCSIYVALFPCNECSKLIIQAGISEVVYASDKHSEKPSTIASKRLLQMAGVKCTRYTPRRRRIVIDFDVIDWSQMNQIPDSPPRPTGGIDSSIPPRPLPCSISDIPTDAPPRATDSVNNFTPPCSVPCGIDDIPTDAPPYANTRINGGLSGSLPS